MLVAVVQEEIYCVANHARDLPIGALMMFGLNIDLPKECLEAANCSLLNHKFHENSLFVEGLAHLLQVDHTDLFPKNGLEKLH